MFTGLLKDARFGPLSNLLTFILLVEVCRLGECLGKDFRPFIPFFSLTCFHAFSNAAHSRFLCGDPKLCLRGSLKMIVLALPQIYTNVFHLLRSIALDRA